MARPDGRLHDSDLSVAFGPLTYTVCMVVSVAPAVLTVHYLQGLLDSIDALYPCSAENAQRATDDSGSEE